MRQTKLKMQQLVQHTEGFVWIRMSVLFCGGYLNCRECNLANVGAAFEAKDTTSLVESYALLDLANIAVHVSNIIQVAENESFLEFETARNNILRVGISKFVTFFKLDVFPQELFVVCQLNDKWRLEYFLKVSSEGERNEMAQMKSVRRGPPVPNTISLL